MLFLLPFKKYLKSPWFYLALLIGYTLTRYLISKTFKSKNDVLATISNSTANNYADSLQQSMGGFGTDEEAIFNILSLLKTKENYNKVYNKFGSRPYMPSTGTYDEFFGNNHNLTTWLFNELNKKERKQISLQSPWVFN